MKTTLNKIKAHQPCQSGWKKLLKYLGKTHPDDEPLSIVTIIESNGLSDTLWCLRVVEKRDKELRLYAVWCARQVQHLMTDVRSIHALDVAERYAHGQVTREELVYAADDANAARVAAYVAANDAVVANLATVHAARSAAYAAADNAYAAQFAADAADAAYVAYVAADAEGDFTVYRNHLNELIRICQLMEHQNAP